MDGSEERAVEIYQQRYETYRHLDKLRWQMLQLALAVIPLAIAVGARSGEDPSPWIFVTAGLIVIGLALVMERIRNGLNRNAVALQKAGKQIGDDDLPGPSAWKSSVSFWIAATLIVFGVICTVIGARTIVA